MKITFNFFFSLLFFCILSSDSFSQSLAFDWAKTFESSGYAYPNAIVSDADGNLIVCGNFNGTMDFDPGVNAHELTATGGYNSFIQKLDGNGNLLWVNQGFDAGDVTVSEIVVDGEGNIYACMTKLIGSYDEAFLVMKFNAEGDTLWSKQIGENSLNEAYSIDLDEAGNIYVGGMFAYTQDFDPRDGIEYNLTVNVGGYDGFLLKLDNNGNFVWVKQYDGGLASPAAVKVQQGCVYVTGDFNSTIDFDPGVNKHEIASKGAYDMFVQKLDTNGNFIWAHAFGNSAQERGNDIEIDKNGDLIIVAAVTGGTIDFDPGAGTYFLSPAASAGILLKLDPAGDFVWAVKNDDAYASVVKIDENNNLLVAGDFRNDITLNQATGDKIKSNGESDLFCQKLDANGSFIWAKAIGGKGSDFPSGLVVLPNGNLVIVGGYQQTVDFDPGNGVYHRTTADQLDCFMVKLSSCSGSVSDVGIVQSIDTLTAALGDATFQWLDCGDGYSIISGENKQFFTTSAEGNYAVQITEGGCVDTSECFNFLITNMQSELVEQMISVYPNPSNGSFMVQLDQSYDDLQLKIFSVSGKTILKKDISNRAQFEMVLDEPSGVYIGQLISKEGILSTFRIIKNK